MRHWRSISFSASPIDSRPSGRPHNHEPARLPRRYQSNGRPAKERIQAKDAQPMGKRPPQWWDNEWMELTWEPARPAPWNGNFIKRLKKQKKKQWGCDQHGWQWSKLFSSSSFFFAGNGYFELDLSYRNVAFSFRPDSRKSVRRKGRKKGKKKERPGKLTDWFELPTYRPALCSKASLLRILNYVDGVGV